MIFIGFDPDLHYPSHGVVQVFEDRTFRIVDIGCLDIPRKVTGYDAVAEICREMLPHCYRISDVLIAYHLLDFESHICCEAMTVRPKQREAINGLLKLQATSGAFASCMSASLDTRNVSFSFVSPHEWKKQVPKDVHQRRIMRKLGIDRKDLGLPEKYAKHVVDAIGIALWAAEKHLGKGLTPATPVI